jgi:hypothetical protein
VRYIACAYSITPERIVGRYLGFREDVGQHYRGLKVNMTKLSFQVRDTFGHRTDLLRRDRSRAKAVIQVLLLRASCGLLLLYRSPRTQVGNRDNNRWRCNAKMGRRLKSKPLIIVMDLRHASDAYRRPG